MHYTYVHDTFDTMYPAFTACCYFNTKFTLPSAVPVLCSIRNKICCAFWTMQVTKLI